MQRIHQNSVHVNIRSSVFLNIGKMDKMGCRILGIYDTIKKLCDERSLSIYAMCSETGISRSVLTELKAGRSKTLSAKHLAKIADYFGVSVDYLLGKESNSNELIGTEKQETKTAPALTKRDERDIARALESFMQYLANAEMLMFDGDPLSDEAKESIITAMRLGMEAAKLKNKEKYTPKKYRKNRS